MLLCLLENYAWLVTNVSANHCLHVFGLSFALLMGFSFRAVRLHSTRCEHGPCALAQQLLEMMMHRLIATALLGILQVMQPASMQQRERRELAIWEPGRLWQTRRLLATLALVSLPGILRLLESPPPLVKKARPATRFVRLPRVLLHCWQQPHLHSPMQPSSP